jgi:hypothetical protein
VQSLTDSLGVRAKDRPSRQQGETDAMTDLTPPAIPPTLAHRGPSPQGAGTDAASGEGPLRATAEAFEAAFLAEMLKRTGLGRLPGAVNGGAGERAFADLLVREYAGEIARTRSLGIADAIERELRERAAAR